MTATVTYREGKRALVVQGAPADLGVVSRMNGAVARHEEGTVLLPATAAFAGRVDKLLPDADWDHQAGEVLRRALAAIAARRFRTADLADLDPLPVAAGRPEHELHQRQAYHFARAQEGVGLWVAMGGGKSRVCVALAVDAEAEANGRTADPIVEHARILVTCPRTVLDEDDVWGKQFARWAPDVPFLVGGRVMRKQGRGAKIRPSVRERLDQLAADERLAHARRVAFVAVVPWDSFWRGDLLDWLLARRWDLWVADEVHRAKAPGGKAAKAAARLRSSCTRRVGNSGTPIPHSRLDAYSVYRLLDPGVFGTNFHRMKRRYAITVPIPNAGGAEKVVGWQNEEDFDQRFHSIAYVWEQDRAVLGIGEPIVVERVVALAPSTWRVYRDLERDLVADIGTGMVTASNALVRLLRLQQVLSGVVTDSEGARVRIANEKADSLADWLQDLKRTEPVAAVGRFHGDLDSALHVADAQDRRVAELSGRQPGAGVEDLDGWNAGRADLIAVQIQAGGTGVDLTRARYAAYLSVGYSLGDADQSFARFDRPPPDGLPERERARRSWPPMIVRFIAEGPRGEPTIDREVWDALDGRRDVVDAILANRRRR